MAFPIPGRRELLISMDAGGNEREQLYLHSGEPFGSSSPGRRAGLPAPLPAAQPRRRALAYGFNRRNGVDLDVYVRALDDGTDAPSSTGAGCARRQASRPTAGCSPCTGRRSARATTSSGSSTSSRATPSTSRRTTRKPSTARRSGSRPGTFLCASNEGRETFAIRRYDVEAREWTTVLESRWDLSCWVDPTGETLLVEENADGYSRVELRDARTLELRRELPLPGRGVLGMPYEEPYFSPTAAWSPTSTRRRSSRATSSSPTCRPARRRA